MLTKQQHIEWWIGQSKDDWGSVDVLFERGRFVHALFFVHLSIEKLCKAIWIRDNNLNVPPKTHNLIFILSQTKIEPTENQSELLLNLNRFQLEGRYPDYLNQLHQLCSKEFSKRIIDEATTLNQWLTEKLQ